MQERGGIWKSKELKLKLKKKKKEDMESDQSCTHNNTCT